MAMILTLVFLCAVTEILCSPYQSFSLQDDGGYRFAFDTSKETGSHSRTEEKTPEGLVVGKYSYEDPNGDLRVVNYQAGDFGYVAKGAVGVAGAPDSQFPAESTDGAEEPQENQDDGNQDVRDEDLSSDKPDEGDNENPEKSLNVQSPTFAVYPDGFPVGFFDQGFHGLRRFPEPVKEEADDDKNKNEKKENKNPKDEDNDQKKNTILQRSNVHPVIPFHGFHPHTWAVPLHYSESMKHPVYVYSYNIPEAHGYYYHY